MDTGFPCDDIFYREYFFQRYFECKFPIRSINKTIFFRLVLKVWSNKFIIISFFLYMCRNKSYNRGMAVQIVFPNETRVLERTCNYIKWIAFVRHNYQIGMIFLMLSKIDQSISLRNQLWQKHAVWFCYCRCWHVQHSWYNHL